MALLKVVSPLIEEGWTVLLELHGMRRGCEAVSNDPIGDMHDNGDIDDAQLEAARWFQALYLKFEGALDGGLPTKDLESELGRIENVLGKRGMNLIYDIGVRGKSLNAVWRTYDPDYEIARWMLDDNLCKLSDYYEKRAKRGSPPWKQRKLSPPAIV